MAALPSASYPTTVWTGDSLNIDRANREYETVPDARDWDRVVSEVIAVQTEVDSVKTGLTTGVPFSINSVSANTTLAKDNEIVYVNCASGNVTITLPAAAASIGLIKTIKKIDSSVNIVTVSGGVIDGDASKEISYQWSAMTLVSDGSGWSVI